MDSIIYNCVDCQYDQNKDFENIDFTTGVSSNIVYQQPQNVRLLIQNYSCPKCGLFAVSIRKNFIKTITKK
jgi:predicted RNA-binding Zn-ribbon protein involved in translation (DUF1610 family)